MYNEVLQKQFNERFDELLLTELPKGALRCNFYKDEEGIYYPVISPTGTTYVFLDTLIELTKIVENYKQD